MTPQEQQMIDGLIDRIRNTQVTDKDLDAERYLQQGLAGNPDTLYILAQTVLVQQYGLSQAQQQIQQLQAALDEARQHVQTGGGSFLSKIFGGPANTQQTQYQPVNNPGYPPPYAPAYAPAYTQPAYPSAGGGFLRGALQTAAGVAMGEMAFESVESLFHGFGGGPYGYGHPSESVVNNYYDDASQPSTTPTTPASTTPSTTPAVRTSPTKAHRKASPTRATTPATTLVASVETQPTSSTTAASTTLALTIPAPTPTTVAATTPSSPALASPA